MRGHYALACRPESEALTAVEQYVKSNAPNLTPKDVKDFLTAFASMEWQPQADVVNAAIAPMSSRLDATSTRDVSALLVVRLASAGPWSSHNGS